jgi:hypothetical protein
MPTEEPNAEAGTSQHDPNDSPGVDPRDDDHPTGARQAEENAKNDPPS